MSKATIRLYALGGAGVNSAINFYGAKATKGFAEIKTCFVDTSVSNMRDMIGTTISDEDVYLLDGVDGSGKQRSANYQEFLTHVKPILHKFKPEDFNIVVSSASGGSGSTLAMIIIKELIERGHSAVLVLIGSEESKITIENTVKTLQSIDNISRKQVKRPIVVSYWHNSAKQSRSANDESIKQTILALSMLTSKENKELDTADVTNFIGFDSVTSVKEGISLLYITSDEEVASSIKYPISSASLFCKYGASADNLTPEYSCTGYPTPEVLKESDLHFVISQHEVESIYKNLDERLNTFKEAVTARLSAVALGGNADDNGIVL